MTKRMLHRRVLLVSLALGLTVLLGFILKVQRSEYYDLVKDMAPLAITIVAAYLATLFQERAFFVQSLRTLWMDVVEAKVELLGYINDTSPSKQRQDEAYRALSKAMDQMRGVYKNAKEDKEYRGWYPYHPLHDMRSAFNDLTRKDIAPHEAENRVDRAWESLRYAFLAELSLPEPTHPITWADSEDPRKRGVRPLQPRNWWRWPRISLTAHRGP